MRTNIEISDELMEEALKSSGFRTKRRAVEEGLRLLIQSSREKQIRKLRGKLPWEGSLEEMRRDK